MLFQQQVLSGLLTLIVIHGIQALKCYLQWLTRCLWINDFILTLSQESGSMVNVVLVCGKGFK